MRGWRGRKPRVTSYEGDGEGRCAERPAEDVQRLAELLRQDAGHDVGATAWCSAMAAAFGTSLHVCGPDLAALRADPRFRDMLKGLGLAEYFRASGNWGDFCRPVSADDFECH